MSFKLCLVFSAIILFVEAKNDDYIGHKVYNVKFLTQEQQNRLEELKSDVIDYWKKPSFENGIVGRAMVPPSHFNWFEEKLQELGVVRDVFIEDVYEYLMKAEKTLVRSTRSVSDGDENNDDSDSDNSEIVFDFDAYYRYNEIYQHMKALEAAYENSTIKITLHEFGVTEENRPLVYLKITGTTETEVEKPVMIVEAGINPREWITVPSALNIVNRLLENETQFLDKSEWIVIPVLNPDGYEYTHTNLRLWTKSRSTRTNLGFICPGVNLNRNFDIDWSISDSSSSPCSHLFAGSEPFSEVETQLIRNLLQENSSRVKLYISLQNTGGYISYPWQFERAASGMFRQHHLLGLEMVAAMNEDYSLGAGWANVGDRASGTSTDYIQQSGILHSFNVGVVQRGDDGVNIPEEDIVEVIEDVWRAVAVAAEKLL